MKKLAKLLLKRLDDWGFKYHLRDCHQPSGLYDIDENDELAPVDDIVEERWSNKDFIDWLLNEDGKEMSKDADELKKLLK